MALARILLGTSPIPIGCTPGFLSREISQQATKAINPEGLTEDIHKQRPTATI